MLGGGRVTLADMKRWEELAALDTAQRLIYELATAGDSPFPTCVAPEEPDTAPINYLALNREFS